MKIAYDAKRYYHNFTGLGNYSRTLVNGLQQLNMGVEALLYDSPSFERTFKLGRRAKADGACLFHGLSNELPRDIMRSGVPSVLTVHDVCWRTFPGMYSWIDQKLYEKKYGWSIRHADRILAISQSTKRDVIRFYGVPESSVKVIYQPVQDIFYTQLDKEKARATAESAIEGLPKNYLLSVGSVNSRKNLLGTLQALARIPSDQRPPLVVIGNGRKYMKECKKFAAEHLGANDVVWATNIPDNDALQAFYTDAMAMLYPSRYEGFGLPVVEALLQGTPVLTSSVSSLPEAAGPHAILVDPTNVDDMAFHLQQLIDSEDLRQQIGRDGEAYCRQQFDPETLFRQVLALYQTMANA